MKKECVKERLNEQELYDSFRWLNLSPSTINTIIKGELWENLCLIKKQYEEFEEYINSINSKKSNKIEELQKNLDVINIKSKNYYWYIHNNELYELDKKMELILCWTRTSKIDKSYFLEDEDTGKLTDLLVIEFKDKDDDNVVLSPVEGGYM